MKPENLTLCLPSRGSAEHQLWMSAERAQNLVYLRFF